MSERFARWIRAGMVSAAVLGCVLTMRAQTASDETVQQAMRQGGVAMAARDFSTAAAAYTRATQARPGFAEAYFNLGLALMQQGKLDEARTALSRSLQLKPGLRGANLFLGVIAYRENRYKEAESRLARETAADPRNAKAFMWLGVCRLAENDAQGAIAPLDKAYALDPTDTDILYHRGRAYLLVANASYDAMFKLDHDSARVHQVLAEAYAQARRDSEAIEQLQLAIKTAPSLPGLHEELGDQYWIVGKFEQAGDAYRAEIETDPNAVTARYKLGSLLVLNQKFAEGVALLRAALSADPALSDAHYYLGVGLTGMGKDQDAILEFERAIAASPGANRAMSSYYRLAQIYRRLHEPDRQREAMGNFLRLKAGAQARHEQSLAQIARKRSELPVEDPEIVALSGSSAGK
jgi:superkiller protein 3